ncbi:DUF1566 domain-containing protein [Aeromonas veronii]|uniref:Lcl C-terminal domain-containing protein n=1 Tax=Aeromonas veronii TaxID=654 RepID=UPI00191CC60E|nr:DUF1566 domain-containing protein [Aeromonas veronii]MBL0440694.1 DUF1566 domain-containing protein [Aeromonas veronii]
MLTINHYWPRAWVLLVLLVLLVLMLGVNAHASSLCAAGKENTAIAATTPSADFSDNGDGTVTHHTTGLIWQRCSLGQSWDGTDCTGEARTYSWERALAAAEQNTLAGFSDWRLPNKNELASIVEYRCYQPAINNQQFPNTPSAWYWSSSPNARNSNDAWDVDFSNGSVNGYVAYGYKYDNGYVRLVRAGQ